MELIEREGYLDLLRKQLKKTVSGEGHTIFLSGEAGIGKTSLVKTFIQECEEHYDVFLGSCDSLFTPRPLAPLHDIALHAGKGLPEMLKTETNKATLFTAFLHYFHAATSPTVIIFEDIHWADEATLDFIKFFTRRIARVRCLFILTIRDTEVHTNKALRNVLGDCPPDITKKISIQPLSKEAVQKMAAEKGYSGEDVYKISGGIPFYVNEILASYSTGIPTNIKDSILAVYARQGDYRREVWELFSVIPDGLELSLFDKLMQGPLEIIDGCMEMGILVVDGNMVRFKHELYKRTIEESLSPLKRMALNKKVLQVLLDSPHKELQPERIVHHAKNGHVYDVVMQYAPIAAEKAAKVGAHVEASRLYLTAIEFSQVVDPMLLADLYEKYSYECYLVNQPRESIIYQQKLLDIWKSKKETEKTGNCFRFLSRLWWFAGNRKEAEKLGMEAIAVMENEPASAAKAMAFSNMAQLKMLADEQEQCEYWGNKAITMSKELGNAEILAHALNNVGTSIMRKHGITGKGADMLQESLSIAVENGFQEHVARAYTNLTSTAIIVKEYDYAAQLLADGIQYCEERDLDSWTTYMLSWKAWLCLETGKWNEAMVISERLNITDQTIPITSITILFIIARLKTRRGEEDAFLYLEKVKTLALATGEGQRIAPVMTALLEYEWHTGERLLTDDLLATSLGLLKKSDTPLIWSEFIWWLYRTRDILSKTTELFEPYQLELEGKLKQAVSAWRKLPNPYEEAFALFNGDDEDKRKALTILHELGASATHEKMKQLMRSEGIRNIPRGIRESTRANPAQLTNRQIDVLKLLNDGLQNKEIADKLFISAKTVDHHITAILFKLDVNTRNKAVSEAIKLGILK